MAKTRTVLEVFLASPGDVVEERQIFADIISEFNMTWGNTLQVQLELIRWETHVRPGFGMDAQDVINAQVSDEYDIFVGVMWGRFGSPTGRAESGTEEEFLRAYSRLRESSGSVPMMFYFKEAGLSPSKTDPKQLAKLQEFKTKISTEYGGLYYQFESVDDFREMARIHISKLIQEWQVANPSPVAKEPAAPLEPNVTQRDTFISDVEGTSTDGYQTESLSTIVHKSIDGMFNVLDVIGAITVATNNFSNKTASRTAEIIALSQSGFPVDLHAIQRISNNSATDLDFFANRVSVEIPELHKYHSVTLDCMRTVVLIAVSDQNVPKDRVDLLFGHLREYHEAIVQSLASTSGFRDAMSSTHNITPIQATAKQRALGVLDELLKQFRTSANQAEGLVRLIGEIRPGT